MPIATAWMARTGSDRPAPSSTLAYLRQPV
jgi:hypothetical protein